MSIEGTMLQNQRMTARIESLITSDDQLESALAINFEGYDEFVRQMMFSAQFGNAEYRLTA